MIIDLWYIIPIGCLSLSISMACCLFCTIPNKQNNYNNNELPISINERTILLDNVNPPPYKERENNNIVLIL